MYCARIQNYVYRVPNIKMAEFPTLGGTCSLASCKLLGKWKIMTCKNHRFNNRHILVDFLPFTCGFCAKVFCLDHRTPDSHDCDRSVATNLKIHEDAIYYNCSFVDCTGREVIPVTCSLCENNFCMRHRLSEDHRCTKLRPLTSNLKSVKIIKAEVKQSLTTQKFRSHKSEETMKRVNLMKLKMKAVGDNGIPQSERMYFNVNLPPKGGETDRSQAYFFSLHWTVGKIVDFIAHKQNIPNFNNVANAKKLDLILTKDESVLPLNQTLSALRENGLDDGSDLKLQ